MGKRDYLGKAKKLGANYANGVVSQTKTKMRYILCDNAPGNWGKSTILSAVADYYLSNPAIFKVIYSKLMRNDRWCVVQEIATGKIVLVQTKGDIPGCYARTLSYIQNKKNLPVDVIICACHPNDQTHQIVEALAGKVFKLYYFSNFSAYNKPWTTPSAIIVKDELKDCIVNIVNQL